MKLLLFSLCLGTTSLAAVPSQNIDESIIQSLRVPHKHALQSLKALGGDSTQRLKEIAFDEKIPMGTRWNAFMVLTQLDKTKSWAHIHQALHSETWFMRSAALTALKSTDSKKAQEWAAKILQSDRALLVRMKAIEVLSDVKDDKTTELFWQKLYANDSFHLNKSLWIRDDITQLLLRRPRKKDLKRWVQLLHDREEKFQAMAVVALAKITKTDAKLAGNDLASWQKRYPAQSVVK